MADFIPRDRIFEIIKLIEANLKNENERIHKIVKNLKEFKTNSILPTSIVSLNLKKKLSKATLDLKNIDLDESMKDSYKNALDKNEEIFIAGKIEKLTVIDANRFHANVEDDAKNKKFKEIQENQNKAKYFYSKLYDVLNKRQSIPRQFKPIFNLELVNKNFDDAKATNIKSINSLNFGNKMTSEIDLNKPKNEEKNRKDLLVTSPILNGKDKSKVTTSVPFSSTPANEKLVIFGPGHGQPSNAQKSLFNNKPPSTVGSSILGQKPTVVTGESLFGPSKQQSMGSSFGQSINTNIGISKPVTTGEPDAPKQTTTSNFNNGNSLFGQSINTNIGISKPVTTGEPDAPKQTTTSNFNNGNSLFGLPINNTGNKQQTGGDSIFGVSNATQFSFNLQKTSSQSTLFRENPSNDSTAVKTAPPPTTTTPGIKSNIPILTSSQSSQSLTSILTKSDTLTTKPEATEQQTSAFGSNNQKTIFGQSSNTIPAFGRLGQSSTDSSNSSFSFTFGGNSQKANEPLFSKPQEILASSSTVTTANDIPKATPVETLITTAAPINKTLNNVASASGENLTASNKVAEQPVLQDSSSPAISIEVQVQSNNNHPAIPIKNTTEDPPKTLRGILGENSTPNLFGNTTASTESAKGFSFNLNTQNSAASKVSPFGGETQQQAAISNDPKSLILKPATTTNEEAKTSTFGFPLKTQPNSFLSLTPADPSVETQSANGGSLFSNYGKTTTITTAPFGAQNQIHSDVSMESNNQNEVPNLFGGLGFSNSSAKPVTNENKNPFGSSNTNASPGGSLFGGLMAQNSQKPTFGSPVQGTSPGGGSIIKGPTFTFNNQNSFGQPSTPFGAQAQPTGNLFSSFTTSPPKANASFGAAPTFGASPALGSSTGFGSTGFGGSSFGAAPAFGSATSPTGFGATSQAPLFGSSGFGSTGTNLFGGGGGSSTNNSTGLSFGQLAQQQPQAPQQQQQNLFSNFSSTQPSNNR